MTAVTTTRAPRLTRDAQRTQRTEHLLDAAWALFCEKGYEAVTIDHIAEQAGYSRMPVYSLFGDKQTLFFELWRKTVLATTAMIVAKTRKHAPLRRNLDALARLTADALARDRPGHGESLYYVAQTIALSRPEMGARLAEVSNHVVDAFAQIVRDSTLEDGERLRGDAQVVGAHIVAQINGLSTVQFQTHRLFASAKTLKEIFLAIALKTAHD